MRIAVVSCWKYRDAWPVFFKLFQKFWQGRQATLVTDYHPLPKATTELIDVVVAQKDSWCQVVAEFARSHNEPTILLQEDFLLNAPVNVELVEHGLKLLARDNVGAVRLYPCPGATESSDDPYFGLVARHSLYRTSCQVTIWKPEYLAAIASRFDTPAEFELLGSPWASANRSEEVWAFKREVKPWPLEYYCSAISRGLWEPAALEFCKQQGIEVDTSMRGVAS